MLRESLRFVAAGALLLGCSSNDVRPASNTTLCVPVDGGPPCRGEIIGTIAPQGGDASTTPPSIDAATVDAASVTTVSGTLRVFPSLPPDAARAAGSSGWTIRSLPAYVSPFAVADAGSDAGLSDASADDAGVAFEAVTDSNGAFTLAGVPPIGNSPTTGEPSYWISANFPVMGNFASMFEIPSTLRVVELQTFTDDSLRVSLNAAGQVQADDRALIAVWVRESRTPGARPVSGVTLEADGQSSQALYDGASGLMEVSLTGTGPLGFAVLPNVPVPASGDGYVTVSGPRVARPFQVRVRTHTVTWLLLTAS